MQLLSGRHRQPVETFLTLSHAPLTIATFVHGTHTNARTGDLKKLELLHGTPYFTLSAATWLVDRKDSEQPPLNYDSLLTLTAWFALYFRQAPSRFATRLIFGVDIMKLSLKTLFAATALPFVVTACASSQDAPTPITTQDLQHHNWELLAIDGQAISLEEGESTPRLEIGEKMTANGHAGCNNFFGQGELKDNQFRIEKMGMTMKMCGDDAMQVEQAFSQTLSDWSEMTLTNQGLELKGAAHTLTFKLNDWKN